MGSNRNKKWVPNAYTAEFNSIVRKVREVALPHIDKRARKNYMDAKRLAEGEKLSKNLKAPLPHLLRERAGRKARIAKIVESDKINGITTISSKKIDYRQILRDKQNRTKSKAKQMKLFD